MDQFFSLIAGILAVNALPHFIHGVSGKSFRTPFARLAGKKESRPLVNVLWGWLNAWLAVSFWLSTGPGASMGLLFLGAFTTSIALALIFGGQR